MTFQQSMLVIVTWLVSFPLPLAVVFEAGAAWAKVEAIKELERRRRP
ncbi:MAG: hypothetical protein ACM309_09645 [Bacillota bacterium]